jgi:dephospho-CoA kinase
MEQEGVPLCILDAPLLFEGGCEKLCHVTVAVLATKDVRENRIIERDGLTHERAEQRINAQPDDEYYTSRCDYTLMNSGDITLLHQNATALFQEIQEKLSLGGF